MRYINDETLREYADDFQELFERYEVKKVKINCTPSQSGEKTTTFYIEPADNAIKLKSEIKRLCGRRKLSPVIYVHGFGIHGKEWNRSKNAIDFNELLEEVRASRNPIEEQTSDHTAEIEKFLLEEKGNLMVEEVNKIEPPIITPKSQNLDLQNVEKSQSISHRYGDSKRKPNNCRMM